MCAHRRSAGVEMSVCMSPSQGVMLEGGLPLEERTEGEDTPTRAEGSVLQSAGAQRRQAGLQHSAALPWGLILELRGR